MAEPKPKKKTFVNVLMPKEMAADLEVMATWSDTDRSKLIRNLIRKEWKRLQRRQENLATNKQLLNN